MNSAVRMLLCFIVLGSLVMGAVTLEPALLSGLGLDVQSWSEAQHDVEEAAQKREELEEQSAKMYQRVQYKEQAITQLLEGRISLTETVACFQAINKRTAGVINSSVDHDSGLTEEQIICQQVLGWLEAKLNFDKDPAAEDVLARFACEAYEFCLPQGSEGP